MGKFTKLDPEFKQRWVMALRSGRYRKGAKFLVQVFTYDSKGEPTEYEYSALGVAGVEAGCLETILIGKTDFGTLHRKICQVPVALCGDYIDNNLVNYIDGLSENNSFEQIAEWIDKHL